MDAPAPAPGPTHAPAPAPAPAPVPAQLKSKKDAKQDASAATSKTKHGAKPAHHKTDHGASRAPTPPAISLRPITITADAKDVKVAVADAIVIPLSSLWFRPYGSKWTAGQDVHLPVSLDVLRAVRDYVLACDGRSPYPDRFDLPEEICTQKDVESCAPTPALGLILRVLADRHELFAAAWAAEAIGLREMWYDALTAAAVHLRPMRPEAVSAYLSKCPMPAAATATVSAAK
jgi:hypothetical protein